MLLALLLLLLVVVAVVVVFVDAFDAVGIAVILMTLVTIVLLLILVLVMCCTAPKLMCCWCVQAYLCCGNVPTKPHDMGCNMFLQVLLCLSSLVQQHTE